MKKFLRTYIAPLLGSISSLMLPAALIAAETITSSGYAYITSSVNKEVFRTRAIENALQKIVLESGQDLNSFSIVENGKVLLDQIQSRSAIKILQYDVIDETIKNKKYHVTVQALLGQEESTTTNNICKKSSVRSIDLLLKVTTNSNDFPAWANISKNWVLHLFVKISILILGYSPGSVAITFFIKARQIWIKIKFARYIFIAKMNSDYGFNLF